MLRACALLIPWFLQTHQLAQHHGTCQLSQLQEDDAKDVVVSKPEVQAPIVSMYYMYVRSL